jgi:hypothetical protein
MELELDERVAGPLQLELAERIAVAPSLNAFRDLVEWWQCGGDPLMSPPLCLGWDIHRLSQGSAEGFTIWRDLMLEYEPPFLAAELLEGDRRVANRTTALLKDAILKAAEQAGGGGGKGGLEAFLVMQAAKENNAPFMALLGKVLPMQLSGGDGGTLEVTFRTVYDAVPSYDEVARAADLVELAALRALPGPPLS